MGYVMDSILVIKLVGFFDGIVYVLFLVIFVYVFQGSVDIILSSDGV